MGGVNRVYSFGFRMFTDKWSKRTEQKRDKFERKLRKTANEFYTVRAERPYISTIFTYHIIKVHIKEICRIERLSVQILARKWIL